MGLSALTKVKMIEVPNTDELNAILFDLQSEGINIISVDFKGMTLSGEMQFIVVYHFTPGADLQNADSSIEEASSEGSEDMGSSI